MRSKSWSGRNPGCQGSTSENALRNAPGTSGSASGPAIALSRGDVRSFRQPAPRIAVLVAETLGGASGRSHREWDQTARTAMQGNNASSMILIISGSKRPLPDMDAYLVAARLTLLSATSVSFLSAAFSSSSVSLRMFAQSARPRRFAHAMSDPYRVIS